MAARQKKTAPRKSRTIFIGDVHGCIDELQEMVGLVAPQKEDRVILLGDLINRGPDSVGVVRYVYEQGFESLIGNHEREYLRYSKKVDAYKKLRKSLGSTIHDWLTNRPLYIDDDKFIAVHAGLQPGAPLAEAQADVLTNIRTWDGSGRNMKDPDNPPWYLFYRGEPPVSYGHWARRGLNLRENTIGLDSGCVYGKRLSAYILEERELLQVFAHRTWYLPPSLR